VVAPEIIFAKVRTGDRWMGMKACRGSLWLGWTALLLIGAAAGRLWAQKNDGDPRWILTTGTSGQAFVYSSPAIGSDGTVYVGVRVNTTPPAGRLLALNPTDGSEKKNWPKGGFLAPDWVDSSPAIGSDGTVYFGCLDGKLYALNPDTGVKKWERFLGSFVPGSPALGPDGTIYIGSYDSYLHAVRASDGVEVWRFETGGAIESSPAVAADGTIYFGSVDNKVYAVTPTGKLKWTRATRAPVLSSPAIDVDGTVYVGSHDGSLYALAPEDGAIRWTYATGGQILSSPVIGADRTIYFGNDDSIFSALRPDGSLRWNISVGVNKSIRSTAAVRSDGTIIFGAQDGVIRAVNPETDLTAGGLSKWSYRTGDEVESSPVVASDGTIYVGSHDGKLYSFYGSGAPASTYARWPMFRGNVARTGKVAATPDGGRLVNLATRALAGNGTPLIAGLVTSGVGEKNYMIRGIGPTLEQLGVSGPLRDPTLVIKPLGSEIVRFSNDNWGSQANAAEIVQVAAAVGAFPLPPESKDAVVLGPLPGGLYTASLDGTDNASGVALIEAYDAAVNAPGARLVNLSTRAQVGTGDNILIPGLVIGGSDAVRLLVRAVGPGLAAFGVSGALARPTLAVYSGSGQSPILTNTGWSTGVLKADIAGAASVAGAFPLANGSADCAALLTLNPGSYTIQVSGVGATTGEALVEVYLLP
jgi:outer membrane protein assembly factor BamB